MKPESSLPELPLPVSRRDHQRLLAIARRLLGNPADAEDTVQDAYLRALSSAPQSVAIPLAWLTTVVQHQAIDTLRRQRRESEFTLVSASTAEEPSAQDQAEASQVIALALRRLVDTLQPDEIAMLLLFEVFDYTHAAIGSRAGKSEAACRQTVLRARRRLAGHPAGEPEDHATADALYGLCLRALQTHSPAPLHAILACPVTSACAPAPQTAHASNDGPRSGIVQVGDGYALMLVHEGRLLCCLHLGPLLREAAPPAGERVGG